MGFFNNKRNQRIIAGTIAVLLVAAMIVTIVLSF